MIVTTFLNLKSLVAPLLRSWVNHYFTYSMYGARGYCLVGLLMSCHRLTVCWCWRRVVVDAAACSTATCYWHNVAPLILPSLHPFIPFRALLLSFLLFKFPRRAAVVCNLKISAGLWRVLVRIPWGLGLPHTKDLIVQHSLLSINFKL